MNSISNCHSERSEESPYFGSIMTVGMLRFTQTCAELAGVMTYLLQIKKNFKGSKHES